MKRCFPHLKIGEPALSGNEKWAAEFLAEMQRRQIPIDFFSWHIYCLVPEWIEIVAKRIRLLLEKYGYPNAESILNEWNYIKGWHEEYVESLRTIHGMKGAAFTMACISVAQCAPVDMLMCYNYPPQCFLWCV